MSDDEDETYDIIYWDADYRDDSEEHTLKINGIDIVKEIKRHVNLMFSNQTKN